MDKWKKLSSDGPQIESQFEIAFDVERNALVIPVSQQGNLSFGNGEMKNGARYIPLAPAPRKRNRFALAYNAKEKITYMFGGRNNGSPFMNDLWRWDGEKWARAKSVETPPGRAAALMEYANDGLYLYGGVTSWGLTNEIWEWQNGSWKLLNADYAMTESRTAQILKEWISMHPNDVENLVSYGTLLASKRQFDEAVKYLTAAHNINAAQSQYPNKPL